MITINDIVIEPHESEDYEYNHGHIKKAVKIFGQTGFCREDERLGLTVPKKAQPDDYLNGLNDYLEWLAGCKDELIAFYKEEYAGDIEAYFDGEMTRTGMRHWKFIPAQSHTGWTASSTRNFPLVTIWMRIIC